MNLPWVEWAAEERFKRRQAQGLTLAQRVEETKRQLAENAAGSPLFQAMRDELAKRPTMLELSD